MKITVYNRQKDLPLSVPCIKRLVLFVLTELDVTTDEVILQFVTQRKICELHGEFFQDPTPTDCISFPIDPSLLGEIFVCPRVAIHYAKQHKGDPYEETALYVIHGLLHLLGYDDIKPAERKKMVKEQNRLLALAVKARLFIAP